MIEDAILDCFHPCARLLVIVMGLRPSLSLLFHDGKHRSPGDGGRVPSQGKRSFTVSFLGTEDGSKLRAQKQLKGQSCHSHHNLFVSSQSPTFRPKKEAVGKGRRWGEGGWMGRVRQAVCNPQISGVKLHSGVPRARLISQLREPIDIKSAPCSWMCDNSSVESAGA